MPPIITIKCKYIDSLATYRRKQMTDRNKFEQMLEHLINDESDKAKELFHQLVVEKSREIYENILAEDFQDLEEKTKDYEDDEEEDDKELDEGTDEEMKKVLALPKPMMKWATKMVISVATPVTT